MQQVVSILLVLFMGHRAASSGQRRLFDLDLDAMYDLEKFFDRVQARHLPQPMRAAARTGLPPPADQESQGPKVVVPVQVSLEEQLLRAASQVHPEPKALC